MECINIHRYLNQILNSINIWLNIWVCNKVFCFWSNFNSKRIAFIRFLKKRPNNCICWSLIAVFLKNLMLAALLFSNFFFYVFVKSKRYVNICELAPIILVNNLKATSVSALLLFFNLFNWKYVSLTLSSCSFFWFIS